MAASLFPTTIYHHYFLQCLVSIATNPHNVIHLWIIYNDFLRLSIQLTTALSLQVSAIKTVTVGHDTNVKVQDITLSMDSVEMPTTIWRALTDLNVQMNETYKITHCKVNSYQGTKKLGTTMHSAMTVSTSIVICLSLNQYKLSQLISTVQKNECTSNTLLQINLLCFFLFFCWVYVHFHKVVQHCIFTNHSSLTASCLALPLFIT